MAEGQRSLRRLKVFSQTLVHWSPEIAELGRHGTELERELETGVKLPEDVLVQAPPESRAMIPKVVARVTESFKQLRDAVDEKKIEIQQALSLHDLLFDITELEVCFCCQIY